MFTKTKIWVTFSGNTYNMKALYNDIILGITIDKTSHKVGYFINNVPCKKGTAKQVKYMVQYINMAQTLYKEIK